MWPRYGLLVEKICQTGVDHHSMWYVVPDERAWWRPDLGHNSFTIWEVRNRQCSNRRLLYAHQQCLVWEFSLSFVSLKDQQPQLPNLNYSNLDWRRSSVKMNHELSDSSGSEVWILSNPHGGREQAWFPNINLILDPNDFHMNFILWSVNVSFCDFSWNTIVFGIVVSCHALGSFGAGYLCSCVFSDECPFWFSFASPGSHWRRCCPWLVFLSAEVEKHTLHLDDCGWSPSTCGQKPKDKDESESLCWLLGQRVGL